MLQFPITKSWCFRFFAVLSAFMLLAIAVCAPAYANAAELTSFNTYIEEKRQPSILSLENTSIQSGITKPVESTFDAIRTVVGAAPKDTVVTIAIYKPAAEDEEPYALARDYSLTVGQSGIFSKTIDLDNGQNFLCVTLTNGVYETLYTALINRKNIEIKKELEQGVVPGGKNPLQLGAAKQ